MDFPPGGFLLDGAGAEATGLDTGAAGRGFSSLRPDAASTSTSVFSGISPSPPFGSTQSPEFASEEFILSEPSASGFSLISLDLAVDVAQEGGFSSGVPKILDAILFLLPPCCSFGKSNPRLKLEPPPGGRRTLELLRPLGSIPL